MRHSRLLHFFLVSILCIAISGFAEAGEVSPLSHHPEQFPYPYDYADYLNPKNNCRIFAHENGQFDVYFPSSLTPESIAPSLKFLVNGVSVYLYDPTTMSNSAKKLESTQISNLFVEFGTVDPQVSGSSMTATADAKKATATVKISDSSLNDIIVPVSIRPQSIGDFRTMLSNSGFKLKNGIWSATCSAKRLFDER